MRDDAEAWIAVATVIPRRLHREAKAYCRARAMRLMDLVAEALAEKLWAERTGTARRGGRAPRTE